MGRGRPVKKDGFVEFRVWLIDCGYNGSTATAYTTHMRRIENELGRELSDAQAVESFFRAAWSDPSYRNLRTAYRMYCKWAQEEKGVGLPTLPDARIGAKAVFRANVPPLPFAVRTAIRQLRDVSSLKLRRITQLAWHDVDQKELVDQAVHVHIVDRKQVGTSWPVRLGTIMPLFLFAQPGGRLATPLVPLTTSADQPYPYDLLLREVGNFTEEEITALRSGVVLPLNEPITNDEIRSVHQARLRAQGLPVPGEKKEIGYTREDLLRKMGVESAPPGSALGGGAGLQPSTEEDESETEEARRLKTLMRFNPKEDEVAAEKGAWYWEEQEKDSEN
jgi:hypothetical protein